jgi:hypothetical protein
MLYRLTIVLVAAGLLGAVVGCENRAARERTIAEETEIDEGFFGDTEVERRELRERNGQYELREETTTIDPDGRVQEQETRIERPNQGTEINVDGGRDGIDVDVRRDRD